MRLSTSTNIYFNRPDGSKGSLFDCIRYCGQGGFRNMDISFLDYTNFRAPFVTDEYLAWVDRALEIAAAYGIRFGQAHAPFYDFFDPSIRDREEKDRLILRSIECAGRMGVKWIAIHAGTDRSSGAMRKISLEKNLQYFLPIVDYAASQNVGIAFENLWDLNIAPKKRYTAMVEDLVELVDAFRSDTVGICFDVEHAVISGLDPVKELEVIGHRLKSTHISDCIDMAADHLLPFSGITHWQSFMEALYALGYQGDFAFEIHRYTQYMPDALVPSAITRAVEVGNYLLSLGQGSCAMEGGSHVEY